VSNCSWLQADKNIAAGKLVNGSVNLRVRRLDPDERVAINTPNTAISVLAPANLCSKVTGASLVSRK
jgi:hypothetical protein